MRNNMLKANPDKFKLLLSDSGQQYFVTIDKYNIQNSESVTLLGIKIDDKLEFKEHVTELCTTASQKLHALSRISQFMNSKQLQILMKAYILSQFVYCPLVWMVPSRK